MVLELALLQTQRNNIQVKCPVCGKNESINITQDELEYAQTKHSLITKAVSHPEEGHVLTLYIDGQGIVRRKYCFDIAESKLQLFEDGIPKSLDSIFTQMLRDATKTV